MEWDFFESDGPVFNDPEGIIASNFANHGSGAVTVLVKGFPIHYYEGQTYPAVVPNIDNNWHTIGALWAPDPNNPGQGLVSFWLDNVLYGGPVNGGTDASAYFSTGGAGSAYPLEVKHMFFVLNGSPGSPSNVDWVKVWVAPGTNGT